MTGALAIYCIGAFLVTLIALMEALIDEAPLPLAFTCAILIGAFWPAAMILYLRHESYLR